MDRDFLNKIRAVILNRIDDPELGIQDLCRAVHLSRTQVHRRLKRKTGKSATHYIRSVRLKHACKLLSDTDLSVTEVAMECGFEDPAFFSRVFKEEFGQPPSAYREGEKTNCNHSPSESCEK